MKYTQIIYMRNLYLTRQFNLCQFSAHTQSELICDLSQCHSIYIRNRDSLSRARKTADGILERGPCDARARNDNAGGFWQALWKKKGAVVYYTYDAQGAGLSARWQVDPLWGVLICLVGADGHYIRERINLMTEKRSGARNVFIYYTHVRATKTKLIIETDAKGRELADPINLYTSAIWEISCCWEKKNV